MPHPRLAQSIPQHCQIYASSKNQDPWIYVLAAPSNENEKLSFKPAPYVVLLTDTLYLARAAKLCLGVLRAAKESNSLLYP